MWIVQGLLALVFLFTGLMKLTAPSEMLAAQVPLPELFVRFLGLAETLGAIGLILPGLLGIRTGLTPLDVSGRVDGYIALERVWRPGERVELVLPMPPRLVEASLKLESARGCAAIERGPMIYCLEQADHPTASVLALQLDATAPLDASWRPVVERRTGSPDTGLRVRKDHSRPPGQATQSTRSARAQPAGGSDLRLLGARYGSASGICLGAYPSRLA